MKPLAASMIALLAAAQLCTADEEPAAPPALPTREEVQQLPEAERLAAREAIKSVMLQRALRQKADGARLTPENAAACHALAEQLQAPAPFVRMLQIEATGKLNGRAMHEHRLAFENLVAAYGVDSLAIRYYTEGLPYPLEDLRREAAALPLQHVFNRVPKMDYTREQWEQQLSTLAGVYKRMAELYTGVSSRAQADAAADALVELLAPLDSTSPLRLALMAQNGPGYLQGEFARLVQPAMDRLAALRTPLLEADYYGSRKLAVVDYLLY